VLRARCALPCFNSEVFLDFDQFAAFMTWIRFSFWRLISLVLFCFHKPRRGQYAVRQMGTFGVVVC
jgi:hypothetical protein